MNQKQAKSIRKFIRSVRPGIDEQDVRYSHTPRGQRIVDVSCFRGMYRQSKRVVKEESRNV